ncbi:Hypothetical protein CINCED_3A006277 [Cinara cedri]|uniref:Uncharacterized protein n=1 Tax=Cinara cedri TaxID=506608 RepID=A0A5E4NKB6_9HEMI|nr:Hypothetical protein CINCED_3A006277 [Cinara cedri]
MISNWRSLIFICALLKHCYGDLNTSATECKNGLDDCLNGAAAILNATKLIGIPKSKQDVDTVCKGFKIGMQCVEDFSKSCLSLDQKDIVNDNVIGAKYTFAFLCDDEAFQKDYLRYTDCYEVINSDWNECSTKFMLLAREEMNANRSEDTKVLDLCCAKHGFLKCVYNTTNTKCGQEQAIFLKKIADTLAENKLSAVCRNIKLKHCNMAQQTVYSICTIILNLFLVVWFSGI